MKYIVFFTALILVVQACKTEKTPEHIRLSNEITKSFKEKVSKKYELNPSGGGGGFMNSVYLVFLGFSSPRSIDVDEAREVYVNLVSDLLDQYNHNEEIRPYLKNYPFTPKNVEIYIIYNSDKHITLPNRVFTVNMSNGKISYRIKDVPSASAENYIDETFEEAYFKVHGKEWTP